MILLDVAILVIPIAVVLAVAGAVTIASQRSGDYQKARQERHQLLSLDDRELRDIGISRADAVRIAEEPLWRRPAA